MNRIIVLALLAFVLAGATACKSNEGAREFVPGKGWVPTR